MPKKIERKRSEPRAVLPKVSLRANIFDEGAEAAYLEIEFVDVDGETQTLLIDRAQIRDLKKVGEALDKRNAALPTDKKDLNELLAKLQTSETKQKKRLAAKVGWQPGSSATFVRHPGVSGDRGNDDRTLHPPLWVKSARHRGRSKGTLKEWKSHVAPMLAFSSRLQLTFSCVCAGPLVRLVNMQPFTVVLFGGSSLGKSAAVLLASSAQGMGTKEEIPSWNVSLSGFHELARKFNDHMLPVDEMGAAPLPRDKVYGLVRDVTFEYAEGAGSILNSKSRFATTQAEADAKGILITTSEHSFDELARKNGEIRDPGEIARTINVPVCASGATTIFDRLPDNISETQRTDWLKAQFTAIRDNCPKYKGAAFKSYMDFVTSTPRDELVTRVRALIAEFETALELETKMPALHHAAKNFGLLYAGGILGIEAGLMAVSKRRLSKSLLACFRDGAALIETPEDAERIALAQLTAGIHSARFRPKTDLAGDVRTDGFTRQKGERDSRRVVAVDPAVFRSWFTTSEHHDAALRKLSAQGLLLLTDGTQLGTGSISMEAVVSFEKLTDCDGKRHNRRWIRFIDLDQSTAGK